jgi:hypothetical protein
MPFTTSYDTVRFDATEAILYLRVRILDGATVVETNENVPVRLPVDASGLVPVGAELTTVIERSVSRTFSSTTLAEKERVYNIAANGGLVVNRLSVYALTEQGVSGVILADLSSVSYLVPVTSLVVDSAAGISVDSTFDTDWGSATVTGVAGNTVSFTPSLTFTPNFTVGTEIAFFAP